MYQPTPQDLKRRMTSPHTPYHWTHTRDHMHSLGQPPREQSGYHAGSMYPVNMEHVARAYEGIPVTSEYNVRYPPGHPRHERLP